MPSVSVVIGRLRCPAADPLGNAAGVGNRPDAYKPSFVAECRRLYRLADTSIGMRTLPLKPQARKARAPENGTGHD